MKHLFETDSNSPRKCRTVRRSSVQYAEWGQKSKRETGSKRSLIFQRCTRGGQVIAHEICILGFFSLACPAERFYYEPTRPCEERFLSRSRREREKSARNERLSHLNASPEEVGAREKTSGMSPASSSGIPIKRRWTGDGANRVPFFEWNVHFRPSRR